MALFDLFCFLQFVLLYCYFINIAGIPVRFEQNLYMKAVCTGNLVQKAALYNTHFQIDFQKCSFITL